MPSSDDLRTQLDMIHSIGIKGPIYKDNINNFTLLLIKEKNGERICIG